MKTHALLLVALLLAGCAGNGDPRDPLEPMNRGVHAFNESVDKVALKPLAEGYRAVVPDFARTGIRNVLSNLNDVTVLANDLLQLKPEAATRDFLRIGFNSTFGFLGMIDIASEMGLRKNDEDFGQTLGRWGVGDGPYLVLPFLGASSFRDGAGLWVDSAHTDPISQMDHIPSRNQALFSKIVSRRAELLEAKKALDAAALDPYEFSRDLYLEHRRAKVYDGKPPAEEE